MLAQQLLLDAIHVVFLIVQLSVVLLVYLQMKEGRVISVISSYVMYWTGVHPPVPRATDARSSAGDTPAPVSFHDVSTACRGPVPVDAASC